MTADDQGARERAEIAARFHAMQEQEQRWQQTEFYIELALTVQPDWKWRRAVSNGRADAQLVSIDRVIAEGADPEQFRPVAIGFYAEHPAHEDVA